MAHGSRTIAQSAAVLSLAAAICAATVGSPLAQKQGGGAFAPAKPAKKKTATIPRPTSPAPAPVSYDGKYRIELKLLEKANNRCFSANRDFELRDGRGALKTWALGDTIGGRVEGTRVVFYLLHSGAGTPWQWTGSASLPPHSGAAGSGTFRSVDGQGKICRWKVLLTRL